MLLLFDLDGTLLRDNIFPPQQQAICKTFESMYQQHEVIHWPIDWVGKTDLQIAREMSEHAGVSFDEQQFSLNYRVMFEHSCPQVLINRVPLGMREVLLRLPLEKRIVSGNIRPVGEMKIYRAVMDHHFNLPKSAFGDQHWDRTELVKLAAEGEPAILVGDTHRDISAAKAAGVKSVGLVTPKHGPEEFSEADAIAHWVPDITVRVLDLAREIEPYRRQRA